jgi:hypothetical protein
MTDKELLELAAKAAGVIWVDECFDYEDMGRMMLDFGDGTGEWNPLKNSAEAFDLLVNLSLMLSIQESNEVRVIWWRQGNRGEVVERFTETEDPFAATRRAIVRAAAAIGRGME